MLLNITVLKIHAALMTSGVLAGAQPWSSARLAELGRGDAASGRAWLVLEHPRVTC